MTLEQKLSRRGFLGLALAALASPSLAQEPEKQIVKHKIPSLGPKQKKDPYAHLRKDYTYQELEKTLEPEFRSRFDKEMLENDWQHKKDDAKGIVLSHYAKPIYDDPEKFLAQLPKKEKQRFQEFAEYCQNPKKAADKLKPMFTGADLFDRQIKESTRLEFITEMEKYIREDRKAFPWLEEDRFSPKASKKSEKSKLSEAILIYVFRTISSRKNNDYYVR